MEDHKTKAENNNMDLNTSGSSLTDEIFNFAINNFDLEIEQSSDSSLRIKPLSVPEPL